MKERTLPPHLRLIKTTNEGKGKMPKSAKRKNRQLSFPYPEASTVFLVYIESIGKNEFVRILGDYAPRWIIDVRTAPRLDIFAASRLHAFSLFEKSKASYVDLFGRLGIKSYHEAESNPIYWSKAVHDLFNNAECRGPYFFLFDNEQQMRAADEILPEVIQPILGRKTRFEVIITSDKER